MLSAVGPDFLHITSVTRYVSDAVSYWLTVPLAQSAHADFDQNVARCAAAFLERAFLFRSLPVGRCMIKRHAHQHDVWDFHSPY